jgi:hypothetical protein
LKDERKNTPRNTIFAFPIETRLQFPKEKKNKPFLHTPKQADVRIKR